jgi:hypothetical protein
LAKSAEIAPAKGGKAASEQIWGSLSAAVSARANDLEWYLVRKLISG